MSRGDIQTVDIQLLTMPFTTVTVAFTVAKGIVSKSYGLVCCILRFCRLNLMVLSAGTYKRNLCISVFQTASFHYNILKKTANQPIPQSPFILSSQRYRFSAFKQHDKKAEAMKGRMKGRTCRISSYGNARKQGSFGRYERMKRAHREPDKCK